MMKENIHNLRERNKLTQEQVAEMFYTSKSNICNIEKGRRSFSTEMMSTSFENCNDAIFLTEVAYEFSNGYLTPASSALVYDDHRICIKERFVKEANEALDYFNSIRLDKRPEYCTQDEIEKVKAITSEIYDVIFEAQALINSICRDYGLVPQEQAISRNQRLKMERRI